MMLEDVNVKKEDAGTQQTAALPVDTDSHLGKPAWRHWGDIVITTYTQYYSIYTVLGSWRVND